MFGKISIGFGNGLSTERLDVKEILNQGTGKTETTHGFKYLRRTKQQASSVPVEVRVQAPAKSER